MIDCQPIIFSATEGLSNRLRAMIGARGLANLNQTSLLIDWESNSACADSFQNLFEISSWPNAKLINRSEARKYRTRCPRSYIKSADWFHDIYKSSPLSGGCYSAFCADAINSLRSLNPSELLQKRISDFAFDNRIDQCIGVHIRATDNIYAYDVWRKESPYFDIAKISTIDGFRRTLKDIAKSGDRVFLSTDNQTLGEQLCLEFDNITMLNHTYSEKGHLHYVGTHYCKSGKFRHTAQRLFDKISGRNRETFRTTSIQDALVDLMLLSRCRKVIGTYYSSFSLVSALIGGTQCSILMSDELVDDTIIAGLNEVAMARPRTS
ncbi:MAG: hypothetical protein WCK77_22275 [Verrucomicrobiota bacterium]